MLQHRYETHVMQRYLYVQSDGNLNGCFHEILLHLVNGGYQLHSWRSHVSYHFVGVSQDKASETETLDLCQLPRPLFEIH